jgi:predicted nuclease of predicted toxin-antitoxin system
VEAHPVASLGLRDAKDVAIFFRAREADATILTKDADFVSLLERHGPPPRIVWITAGNTSNARLRALLGKSWSKAVELLKSGESLVEIQSLD